MLQSRVRPHTRFNQTLKHLLGLLFNLPFLCFIQPGSVGSTFSMSAPITKVVKNDAYTAPRPPVPVAPTRPNTSMAAARSSAAALQPVSRTLQQSAAETSTTAPTPPQVNIAAVALPGIHLHSCDASPTLVL